MEALLVVPVAWFYVSSSFVVVFVARAKRRDAWGWWGVSLIVSPLIALIALAAVPPGESSV